MADDTDTTRPGEADAVSVALAVAHETVSDMFASAESVVEAVVAAAYPVIAAAVREQAAQDIEAMDEPYWDTDGAEVGWSWARDDAARIVRGGR